MRLRIIKSTGTKINGEFMERIKKNWPILALLLAIAGCLFILNMATLISPDDYSYAFLIGGDDLKITSFTEIKNGAKYLYSSWTGRIIPHILVAFFMTTSTMIFKVLNTLLFVALLVIINRFMTHKNSYVSLILAFGFLVYGKMFGEKFAWISRKFELFMDNNGVDGVFIHYLWLFCGKPRFEKMAKNFREFMWIFSWFFA